MKVRVETYSGYKADERPLRFQIGDRKLEVVRILDRWYGPDYSYFKILADDNNTYILRHHAGEAEGDSWSLTSYRQSCNPEPPQA